MSLIHFFFFNDTATTEIYTLSLHDALPIFGLGALAMDVRPCDRLVPVEHEHAVTLEIEPDALEVALDVRGIDLDRSEEHTSELQSRQYLVCRLLLEKKKLHLHTFRPINIDT